jgi:hypothetical protein
MIPSETTIVSCYYPLSKSKHTIQEYVVWIFHFLTYVDTSIVLFTDETTADMLEAIRTEAGLMDRLYLIKKPFHELKFTDNVWFDHWMNQLAITNWPDLHTVPLFIVWANKSFFVEEVIRINPFQSSYFIWCDAGCWRHPEIAKICGKGWPDARKITPNKLHIISMNSVEGLLYTLTTKSSWTHEEVVVELPIGYDVFIGGTILLGDREAWTAFIPAFEQTLHLFIKNNYFAGDDQHVILSTTLWLRVSDPEHAPILYMAPKDNGFFEYGEYRMGDRWFAFQQHFSQHDFRLDTY